MTKFLVALPNLCLLVFLVAYGCITSQSGEQRVDLQKVHQVVDLAERRFSNAAALYQGTDPELYDAFLTVGERVGDIDAELERAIAAGEGAPDLFGSIDLALAATVELVAYTNDDPSKQAQVRAIGILIQTALDTARILLTPNQPTPP